MPIILEFRAGKSEVQGHLQINGDRLLKTLSKKILSSNKCHEDLLLNRRDYYFLLFTLRTIENMLALTIHGGLNRHKKTQVLFFLNMIKEYCYVKQEKWIL